MPQLTLEYTENIQDNIDFQELFQSCHQVIAETLPTDISGCKSRAVKRDTYYIGDGDAENAYAHIQLAVMPGRDQDTLKQTADALAAILRQNFHAAWDSLQLQITVEVRVLGEYVKMASTSKAE